MNLKKITKIIKLLLLKDSNFLNLCKKLNNKEKKIIINYLIESKIEEQVFLNFPNKQLKQIFTDKQLELLNNSKKRRQLRTLENLRYANLIAKDLNKNNIRYVFLKGLSQYGNSMVNNFERNIFDIDLLIDKGSLGDVLEVCKKNGFQINEWGDHDLSDTQIYNNPTIKHIDGISIIDIHTDMHFKKHCSNANKIFNKSFLTKAESVEGYFCSLEDLFIHTLHHGACKGTFNVGPVFFIDMIRFLSNKKIKWCEVKQDLKAFDLEQYFIDVLSVTKKIIKLPIELHELSKKPSTLQHEDIFALLVGQSGNVNFYSEESSNIFRKITNKFFNKEAFMNHSKDKFTTSRYFKYLLRSLRLFFVKIIKNKSTYELMNLRKNYANSIKRHISKPKS